MEDVFPNLEGYEESIRSELGVDVGVVSDRYAVVTHRRVETRDRGNWESMAEWLHERLEAYMEVIGKGPVQ